MNSQENDPDWGKIHWMETSEKGNVSGELTPPKDSDFEFLVGWPFTRKAEPPWAASMFLIGPKTEEAKEWVDDNVLVADNYRLGPYFAVGCHYFQDIVSGITSSGLKWQADFNVSDYCGPL